MPGQPIVPSKDALRALRSLAYLPSAAFVGTTGALCGVAALHYNERNKLRRVEKILETKRKLHSISKGRGSAQLALMFAAAERGDDFTICRNRIHKPSRVRRQSVLAVQHERPESSDWTPFVQDLGESTDTERTLPDFNENNVPAHDPKWIPVGLKPLKSKSKSVSTYHIEPKDQLWYEMRKTGYKRRRGAVKDIRHILGQGPDLTLRPGNLAEQSSTDLNPLPEKGSNDSNHIKNTQAARMADDPKPYSIVLGVDNSNPFSSNSFSALQPWPTTEATEEVEERQQTRESPSDESIENLDLYVATDADCPLRGHQTKFPSRYDFTLPEILKNMDVVGIKRYNYVYSQIMMTKEKYGTLKALSLLEQTMDRYTTTDRHSDFALIQALFLDCIGHFSPHDLMQIVWRFVAKFLQGDMPRLEVVVFLYPRLGGDARPNAQYYYYLAHQYLESICRNGNSLDQQVNELRKVALGTQRAGIDLHEHIMIPVLRSYCHAGRMSAAQALFKEMTSKYKMQTTFYTLQVLVKGHARIGNWSRVKAILDDCHTQGMSLGKAYGISGLMVSIIRHHILLEPLEKVITFAMHTIRTYGIHPISGITREIIGLCIRHRRYDLTVSWLNMVRTEFPFIETGTNSSTFAFEIACVWKDINASCEDILHGLRAIAHLCVRDPFSNVFRAVISEAASRYLGSRLSELRSTLGLTIPDAPILNIKDTRAWLQKVKTNLQNLNLATRSEYTRARLLLLELQQQCNALRAINALCGGFTQSHEPTPRSRHYDSDRHSGNMRSVSQLPFSLSEIQTALMKKYSQREKAGKPIEHDSLRETAAQLVQQNREADAFQLIQSIYQSRWNQPPSGLEFDIDLFLDWMKAAWHLKSSTMLRTVLWAIVNAGPQLKVDSRVVLLARIAAPKAHQQRNKHARIWDIDEIEYLRVRLKRRRWATNPDKMLMLQNWKGLGKHSQPLDEL